MDFNQIMDEKMTETRIIFQGYTWDEYFYVISEKRGVLVTYCGSLDSEGSVKMDEILYVDGAGRLREIYERSQMQKIRSEVSENGGKLFFSYAETDENYFEIAAYLNEIIKPRFNNNRGVTEKVSVLCKGACSLFPDKISKQ